MSNKWSLSNLWGKAQSLAKAETPLGINTSPSTPNYDWGTDKVVDVDITRGLYHNRLNRYALSAFVCKPIINSNVSFIGRPYVTGSAAEYLRTLSVPYTQVHTMAERDGDCFVWVQWNKEKREVEYIIVPPEKVTKSYINPETKKVIGYLVEERFSYNEPKQGKIEVESQFYIFENNWRHVYKSGVKSFDRKGRNVLGFLPIVQFSNSRESREERGHSEYENLLPQLKLYNDMTFDAGHAQHTDGHPKISVEGVEDVAAFFDSNWGEGTADRIRNGESISMDTKDLYVTPQGSVKYLQRGTPTGDFRAFSEIVFTQLVEGSETPEVNFGANMGTSLASVKEQRPVWVKKIERKQDQYGKGTNGEGWEKAHLLAIRINNAATFGSVPEDFDLSWPTPDFKSDLDNAEILEKFGKAFSSLKITGAIGDKEIYNTLKTYDFVKVEDTYDKHKQVVKESQIERDDKEEREESDGDGDEPNNRTV